MPGLNRVRDPNMIGRDAVIELQLNHVKETYPRVYSTLHVMAKTLEPMLELKNKFSYFCDRPVSRIELSFNGEPILDRDTPNDVGLKDNDKIDVTILPPRRC